MNNRIWPAKNSGDTETYEFNWAPYLGAGEAITASTAAADAGSDVVVVSQVMAVNVQVVKLSGGTARATPHVVVLGITTNGGNTPHRRVRIKVRPR